MSESREFIIGGVSVTLTHKPSQTDDASAEFEFTCPHERLRAYITERLEEYATFKAQTGPKKGIASVTFERAAKLFNGLTIMRPEDLETLKLEPEQRALYQQEAKAVTDTFLNAWREVENQFGASIDPAKELALQKKFDAIVRDNAFTLTQRARAQ